MLFSRTRARTHHTECFTRLWPKNVNDIFPQVQLRFFIRHDNMAYIHDYKAHRNWIPNWMRRQKATTFILWYKTRIIFQYTKDIRFGRVITSYAPLLHDVTKMLSFFINYNIIWKRQKFDWLKFFPEIVNVLPILLAD